MTDKKSRLTGRHFLQIPGPGNIPERVMRAINQPVIDHRSSEFAELSLSILDRLKTVFKTSSPVVVYPSSGSGAWEAAFVNTLSPKDRILMFETGHFASLWRDIALRLGIVVDYVPGDWRSGVDTGEVEEILTKDKEHEIKAVVIVHNETSTGVETDVGAVRKAIDAADHPALFIVDAISSLGSMDYRHEEWGVDVTVGASQKGLMLPPGLGFNAVSDKAVRAMKSAQLPRSYWDWNPILDSNTHGFFPYTPATNLLFGLDEALTMLLEEGLDSVFARHSRFAKTSQLAVRSWGLEMQCLKPEHYSNTLTAVRTPGGYSADALRRIILKKFNMSLGTGLGKVKDRVFRIGHLGYFNELMLAGTLCGVEMGLDLAGIPYKKGGLQAALEYLKK